MNETENRQKVIVRTSIIGIAANIVLSAFKAFVGFATNSIAVTLDAVNNLSDALSSVITIVGAKLSNKLPNKKHPLGYGRIEYLSAMVVAAIVLYAGGTSAVESVKKIKALLTEEPQVHGAYDVILNNYGPDKFLGSVHLELPDTMTVEEVDVLTRRVQARVLKETGVILTGVGVYSYNTKNDEAAKIRSNVLKLVKAHEWALQLHGFYVNFEDKAIRFDVVMNFEIKPQEGLDILHKEIREAYPDYDLHIAADIDAS